MKTQVSTPIRLIMFLRDVSHAYSTEYPIWLIRNSNSLDFTFLRFWFIWIIIYGPTNCAFYRLTFFLCSPSFCCVRLVSQPHPDSRHVLVNKVSDFLIVIGECHSTFSLFIILDVYVHNIKTRCGKTRYLNIFVCLASAFTYSNLVYTFIAKRFDDWLWLFSPYLFLWRTELPINEFVAGCTILFFSLN